MSEFSGTLGVSTRERGHQFAVWAPNAKAVSVVGTMNDWNPEAHPMQAIDGGIWWCDIDGCENGAEYKFQIQTADDEPLLKNDPRARKLTNSIGNSVVYDDDFEWEVTDFELPPVHERVIYEIHIGTFNKPEDGNGTFASAIEKLPELQALGVNVVELMPINEFAGDISWGYNPAHPYAVEEAYGGPDGLKRFVDAAHKAGIGVVLDVVYNHFGPSDMDIWQFDGWSENDKGGIYFYNDHRSATPWGDSRPDYGRPEVRSYIYDNALMWLSEFKADGLRMDMVPYIRCVSGADTGEDDIPEAYELIQKINGDIRERFPHKMTIAEDLHEHHFITDAIEDGGCGYTNQWDATFLRPIRITLAQTNDEYVDLQKVEGSLLHIYSGNAYARVVYTESHDEVANERARVVEQIAPGNVDSDYFARQKGMLAGALTLTSAGIPMLFQGQDFKEAGWFNDENDLDWSRKERFAEYAEAYKQLVALRKNTNGNSAGLTGGNTEIVHRDDDNKVIGYKRSNDVGSQNVYVYIQLSNNTTDNYRLDGLAPETACLFAWSDGLKTEELEENDGYVKMLPYSIMIFAEK
ncbi:1,4-alpha-glucan branching protein [Alteromonas pelagimontana]|uniref:1,4-alpha-glucan branching protein n=1 Tax=Alteromonas pelagimontana TaxID=1858656 RepID=A0A6M4MAX7_9ALTE|nr:alpha-amylase family glycosyl hydrolase [Alteromonas pelagimontana]QJR80344.1 1,4-alpha-glucan branching protein [Alteromonas pelagimontana]